MRRSPSSQLFNVGLLGQDEIQEVDPPPLAGLTDAQENKVLPQTLLSACPANDSAQFSKRPDCILRVVVVPRNAIMSQERE